MSPSNRCSVPLCRNHAKDYRLYQSPQTDATRAPWIKYLRDHGKVGEISKYFYICEVHFKIKIIGDGIKHRVFRYPTIPMKKPKSQLMILNHNYLADQNDRTEKFEGIIVDSKAEKKAEAPSRPTYLVKIDMEALNAGDVKNLIQNIRRVNSSSKIQENENLEQNGVPVSPVKSIDAPLVPPKVFSFSPVKNLQPKLINKAPTKILLTDYKTVAPDNSSKFPSVTLKILPGTFKKTPLSFKSITLGSRVIPLKPQAMEIEPINIKQEPEASPSESNFRIEAVHENFQEAMEVDMKKELEDEQENDTQILFHDCPKCSRSFEYITQLLLHDLHVHKKGNSSQNYYQSKPEIFECKMCRRKFLHMESLRYHIKSDH